MPEVTRRSFTGQPLLPRRLRDPRPSRPVARLVRDAGATVDDNSPPVDLATSDHLSQRLMYATAAASAGDEAFAADCEAADALPTRPQRPLPQVMHQAASRLGARRRGPPEAPRSVGVVSVRGVDATHLFLTDTVR